MCFASPAPPLRVQVAAIVRECMEVVPVRKLHLSVPLAVKMSMGRSWGDLKEVELLPL